jgi:hypothetical protein
MRAIRGVLQAGGEARKGCCCIWQAAIMLASLAAGAPVLASGSCSCCHGNQQPDAQSLLCGEWAQAILQQRPSPTLLAPTHP